MTIRRNPEPSNNPIDASRAQSPRPRLNRPPSTALRHQLAATVRRLRTARGWTQYHLSASCGLPPPSYVSDVEEGRVNIALANLEARAVDLECWPTDPLIPTNPRLRPRPPPHPK